MKYTPIIGTLGYVLSPDKKKVLMVHRIARKDDDQLGKFNGLGGKMEKNEDVHTCMEREIFEEAGIRCKDITLRGTVNWTGFGPKNENWLGFIFRIDTFEGSPFKENNEGPLEWVEIDQLDSLPMWKGDKHYLGLVFDEDPRMFHGYMAYEGDEPTTWSFVR
ncbi:MAG: 8-oxo-dGTP diphosphatase [Chlamydiota bacterium]|nr:8-oxo-dGTP diphosphatase [Chlamydiota bacterium]